MSGLVLLFLVAPLLGLFFSTSLPDLFQAAADVQVQQSIGLTLGISALTTLIAAVFALPLAYLMARKDFRGKALLQGLMTFPLCCRTSAAGIAVLVVLQEIPTGRLADLFWAESCGEPFCHWCGHGFRKHTFPDQFRPGRVPGRAVAARAGCPYLGASPFRVFRQISLPLAKTFRTFGTRNSCSPAV
jgi:molybdate/tungstate transport system permease protein